MLNKRLGLSFTDRTSRADAAQGGYQNCAATSDEYNWKGSAHPKSLQACLKIHYTRSRIAVVSKVSDSSGVLFLLEHVDREAIGVHLTGPVGPKAIHLIAPDTFNGHQRPS